MKITLLTTSIFLLLSFSSALEEVVLDTSGNTLRVGSYYFIEAAPKPKNGPGLGLGVGECPPHINAQEGYGGVSSLQLQKTKRRRSYFDGYIILSATVSCYHHNVKRLDAWITGGDVGNPGPKTVRNWFKIEKYGGYYKLVYCPKDVCKDCKVECKDIGTSKGDGDGSHLLVLSDKPYKVQFRRA